MATTADDPVTTQGTAPDAPTIDLPVGQGRSGARVIGRRPRRTKVSVRRFGILSVLKFSLIFSLCLMLVVWLALLLIYLVLQAGGVIESITTSELACLVNEAEGTRACAPLQINTAAVFTALLFAGVVMAGALALVMTFAAVMYNLIGDMVGGVEVTLSEKR
jgi:ABC-type multidrug transport system fused ATPase/permease subunit